MMDFSGQHAEDYVEAKSLGFRSCIEEFTLLKLAKGKNFYKMDQ